MDDDLNKIRLTFLRKRKRVERRNILRIAVISSPVSVNHGVAKELESLPTGRVSK